MESLPDTTLHVPHPGELLVEEFLIPCGVSQYRLAKAIAVPQGRISEIVSKKRSITADTALRFARYFCTSAEFWLNLQNMYDLRTIEPGIEAELNLILPNPDVAARIAKAKVDLSP